MLRKRTNDMNVSRYWGQKYIETAESDFIGTKTCSLDEIEEMNNGLP